MSSVSLRIPPLSFDLHPLVFLDAGGGNRETNLPTLLFCSSTETTTLNGDLGLIHNSRLKSRKDIKMEDFPTEFCM